MKETPVGGVQQTYGNGNPAIVHAVDGGSFAFYPSGRMAVCVSKIDGMGLFHYFYHDDPKSTVLSSWDPIGHGSCNFISGKDKKGNKVAGPTRLTSTLAGGTYVDEEGVVLRSWTELKPLKAPAIEFELNPYLSFRFQSRQNITVTFNSQGISAEYSVGEHLLRTDTYVQKAIGLHKMGPEKGKFILDVSKCRPPPKKDECTLDEKTRVTAEDFSLVELRSILGTTEALQADAKAGKFQADPFISKAEMTATMSSFGKTLGDTGSDRGTPSPNLAATGKSDGGMEDSITKLLQSTGTDNRPLPLSTSLSRASGRYRPEHGPHMKTSRKKLRVLNSKNYDDFVRGEVPNSTVCVVCCLAGWLPHCTRVEQMLEQVNGEINEGKPVQGAPSNETKFILRKYDMSESRLIRDRHNINTLPMYLMYYEGKLVYASNTLNGYGSTKDDLRKQVTATFMDAQRGQFLPETFKFGETSDKLTESFGKTLQGMGGLGATTNPV